MERRNDDWKVIEADKSNILPPHIEQHRQIVGPEQWQQKKKSRKAKILRCCYRKEWIATRKPHITLQANDHQNSEIIVKYLEEDDRNAARQEIANLRLLRYHHHTILYLEHFETATGVGIVLYPSASCDLADLMADMSQAIANNSTDPRLSLWALPEPIVGLVQDPIVGDTSYQWSLNIALSSQMRSLSSFFHCLCNSLSWVHDTGLCHRDIKPENILVTTRGTILLADFGSAQSFQALLSTSPPASVLELKGCAKKYAAPEVYRLVTCHTAKSDIFSLGAVFSEMLTLLAGCTLESYDRFRLEEDYKLSYWQQPVYSQNISRIQKWLGKSISMFESIEQDSTRVLILFRAAVQMTAKMINESPVRRPMVATLKQFRFFAAFSCKDCA